MSLTIVFHFDFVESIVIYLLYHLLSIMYYNQILVSSFSNGFCD